MTDLCHRLYHDFDHEGWNEYDLAILPGEELVFLCRVMGIPDYGNKQTRIVRLLSLRICRKELAKFGSDYTALQEVVASFKKSRLHWMATQACLWKSGTKIQLAQVLLNWRNKCRHDGQKYLAECDAFARQVGQQLALPL
jgi:hypothetical protein